MKTVSWTILALACVATPFHSAHAYLDPGTGSLLLQGLIGGIAAGLAVIQLNYARLKGFIARLRGDAQTVEEPKGTGQ